MPTILHVPAPAAVGGMESVVHRLTRGLVAAGTPVHAHIIVPPDHEPPLARGLREGGVQVHVTAVTGRRYGVERERTRALCREFGVEVVHSHGYRTDVIDAPAARGIGLPVVSTVHGFTGGGWKNALYERLQLRALRQMDRVLAVSRPLVDLLRARGVPPSAIRLVPNAWAAEGPPLLRAEARQALGLGEAAGPLVGWIGRLSREKGPDVLVEAAALVEEQGSRDFALFGFLSGWSEKGSAPVPALLFQGVIALALVTVARMTRAPPRAASSAATSSAWLSR